MMCQSCANRGLVRSLPLEMLSMEGFPFGIFNQEVESGFVLDGACDGELECCLCAVGEVEVGSVGNVLGFAKPLRGQGVSNFLAVLSVLFHVVCYRCDIFFGENGTNEFFECFWG